MNRTITLLVSIACIGCDGVFGLIPVAALVDGAAVCVGCTSDGGSLDGGIDSSSHPSDSTGGDGSAGNGDASTAFTCMDNNVGQGVNCNCIYSGAGCAAGFACDMQLAADDSTPATCDAIGTAALGTSCNVNPSTAAEVCVPGAWCAWGANTHATGIGTCRQVCDPFDRAGTPSCTGGQTCHAMPECGDTSLYPNCSPNPNTHVGYCQ